MGQSQSISCDELMELLGNLQLTFIQWQRLFGFSHVSEGPLAERILEKAARLADTFEDWYFIHRASRRGSKLKAHALDRLSEKNASKDRWRQIYESAPHSSELYSLAREKLANPES